MSNKIDKDLFKQIFDHKFETLAKKLINTINIEENQIIIKNTKKNKDKLFKLDKFNDWVIQPYDRRINLNDAIDLILDSNVYVNSSVFFLCVCVYKMVLKITKETWGKCGITTVK